MKSLVINQLKQKLRQFLIPFFQNKNVKKLNKEINSSYNEYLEYLQKLIQRAIQANAVETMYAVLEVSGMYFGHWNPKEEISYFFNDFYNLLNRAYKQKRYPLRKYRIGLLMYCHLLEMSFAHNFIMNLLRIIDGKRYFVNPFSHSDKQPPALSWKINQIKELAKKIDEIQIIKFIDEFYDDDIRNSFYHSDYCITNKSFNYKLTLRGKNGVTSIKLDSVIELRNLEKKIVTCFAFFEALFTAHLWLRRELAKQKKFHKWPNYEVLELHIDKEILYGFSIHFSNFSKATFTRQPQSVLALNIDFEKDGSVNFNVGDLSKLTKEYLVNGQLYKDEVKV